MKEFLILVAVAMEVEGQWLLNKMENLEEVSIGGYKFYKGKIYNRDIVMSFTKVGVINAAAALGIAINKFNPSVVINMGIVGATDLNMHIKDIVIGESCININSYWTAKAKKGEGSNLANWELVNFLSGEEDRLVEQKGDSTLIELTKKIDFDGNVYYGKIGSGDIWNNEYDRIMFLNDKYHILCEDMEAISIYTVANQAEVPVISIKMISDNSLTGEEYDREVGKYLDRYILKYLKLLMEYKNKLIN